MMFCCEMVVGVDDDDVPRQQCYCTQTSYRCVVLRNSYEWGTYDLKIATVCEIIPMGGLIVSVNESIDQSCEQDGNMPSSDTA